MKKILAILGLIGLIATASSAAMVIGVEGGFPFMEIAMNDTQTADLGVNYTNTNANNNTITLWGRMNNAIATVGEVKTSWGIELDLATGKTGGADQTVITLQGLVGAEYKVSKQVGIYGNIALLSLTSTNTGGAATTSYNAVAGSATAYSGIKVYL